MPPAMGDKEASEREGSVSSPLLIYAEPSIWGASACLSGQTGSVEEKLVAPSSST
jgi:hypothetical protein